MIEAVSFLSRFLLSSAVVFSLLVPLWASEADAVAISVHIRARHMPFGTILDPIYVSATSNEIIGYTRCGDSALWTGAYLAAEAFRYKVTQSADALNNLKAALAGLKALTDVTGDNRISRCMVLADSPFAAGIASEEAQHTINRNLPWIWAGNTSRDQVVGAFFGLGAAYDLVDDDAVKKSIGELATRLTGFISRHQWSPNDDLANTFLVRPEELQTLLQVTRHVDPSSTVSGPFIVLPTNAGVLVDVQGLGSYFKFNLDYMSFYHLVRLQDNDDNRGAYRTVRNYTTSHQNPFFNLIDRALGTANSTRDSETRVLLEQWLQRTRRDFFVDLTKTVPVCLGRACQPIPIQLRTPTDFLWQRDPFQLVGGGSGFIESAGVDYILPYWMGRYYGVIPSAVQSAAASSGAVAPNSIASFYGTRLSAGTAQASFQPLPTTLGGLTLVVTDAAGTQRLAPLVYVSPSQINFLVPDGTVAGPAKFMVSNGLTSEAATASVEAVKPTLFSVDGSGSGLAAATAVLVRAANPQVQTSTPVFQCTSSGCVSVSLKVNGDPVTYLTLYGTGIRNRSSLGNVVVTMGRVRVPVLYAGPTPGFTGLDQVNVALLYDPVSGQPIGPSSSTTTGPSEADVVVTVDGCTSNAVRIGIQ
jgi:uncharacterized protein (TIGR03437 family)